MSPFTKKRPIQWGIIGCGAVTEVKSGPAYHLTDGFGLHGVMRRNLAKARDYAQRHQVPFFTDNASEIIHHPNIDAVYIATPPDSHKEYGLQVAAAGKPCCIEKPMAPSYQDSLEIYKAFEKRALPLFIAYYRRSLPRFNKVKEWLDAGLIGTVRHVHWVKTRTPSPVDLGSDYNWRTDAKVALAGYFDDLASHGLDLCSYLLGQIEDAKGFAVNQQGLYTAFDAVSGSWIHRTGVLGSGTWNFGSAKPVDKMMISGSEGEIQFSVLGEEPVVLKNRKGQESLFIEHPTHLHEFHVKNMGQHLWGEAKHPSTGESGLHTSWVMDKILGRI